MGCSHSQTEKPKTQVWKEHRQKKAWVKKLYSVDLGRQGEDNCPNQLSLKAAQEWAEASEQSIWFKK